MLDCKEFYDHLQKNGVDFFCGVPDSLLKSFCAYISDNAKNHIITPNEGNAVALAAGHYLATAKPALVYLQNSGQGNIINPLISLCDKEIYQIPLLILIGFRGEPGVKDEPQHKKQGEITLGLFDEMGIKYEILPSDINQAKEVVNRAIEYMALHKEPYAIVVKKDTFSSYKLENKKSAPKYELSREDAVKIIIDNLSKDDAVVATTGMLSRELFEYRKNSNQSGENDFLTVGGMGHCSSIAMGIALSKNDKQIFCLDGDGAVIMHMGAMAMIGTSGLANFKHIIINNGAHDSVGGQDTIGFDIDFCKIAAACNYKNIFFADDKSSLLEKITKLRNCEGPSLFEIRVKKGARADLGRPTTKPLDNKEQLMKFLAK